MSDKQNKQMDDLLKDNKILPYWVKNELERCWKGNWSYRGEGYVSFWRW